MVVHKVTFFQNCPLAPDGLFESIDSCRKGSKMSQKPTAASRLIKVSCSMGIVSVAHNSPLYKLS